MSGLDQEFGEAIRSAFQAFRPYANHFRKPAQQEALAPLIDYLRSDKELERGEREYLADLLAGEMGRPRGAPQLSLREKWRRRDICERVIAVKAKWKAEGRKRPFHDEAVGCVAQDLAKRPRAERATAEEIRGWLKALPADWSREVRQKYSQNKSDQI